MLVERLSGDGEHVIGKNLEHVQVQLPEEGAVGVQVRCATSRLLLTCSSPVTVIRMNFFNIQAVSENEKKKKLKDNLFTENLP